MLPVAILAGGLAMRLRPITEKIPKSLVEVAGKPFLFHQLDLLQKHGVTKVVLCIGNMGEQIQAALAGAYTDMEIGYSFDGPQLRGTGGAIVRALPLLGDAFFIMYGDAYARCDFAAAAQTFRRASTMALMTIYRNENRGEKSNVALKAGGLVHYDKHNPTEEMSYIDFGIGILTPGCFVDYPTDAPLDLAKVYGDLSAKNQLAGFEVHERVYEMGSPQGLEETRRFLGGQTYT